MNIDSGNIKPNLQMYPHVIFKGIKKAEIRAFRNPCKSHLLPL